MPNKSPQKAPRRGLFTKADMLSFALDATEAESVRDNAAARGIPFSQWLREAAREKLARETKKAA
jgi:hypothetical protein